MTRRRSSASRLFYFALLWMILATVAAGFWAASRFRSFCLKQTESALLDQTRLLGPQIEGQFSLRTAGELQAAVTVLAGNSSRRVTVISATGLVLADSLHDPANMDNHADRPEVRQAFSQGQAAVVRRSSTLHQDFLYVALRLGPEDRPLGCLRLAADIRSVNQQIQSFYSDLGYAAGLTLTALAVLCWVFAQLATRPVRRIAQHARAALQDEQIRCTDADRFDEFGDIATALNELADELARTSRRSAALETDFRVVLDSMVEGFIRLDGHNRIRLANARAASLLSFDKRACERRGLADVVDRDDILALVRQASRSGQVARRRLGPTATALDLEVVAIPVSGADRGVTLLARDVAESKRYQSLRSEFVANVSHELRTPLTFIRGFVETLRDGAINDTGKRDHFLQRIERNVEQLANLVNDLLSLSELEEQGLTALRQEVDLLELLDRLHEAFQPLAERKRQKLLLEADSGVPRVSGSPRDLECLFSNLLDNALKYTDEGGWVTIGVASAGGDVVVSVEDTGIGIPADDLPRIFERFYRVDKSRSRDMGGTGLGLSIVKHIVQAHRGRIEVDSKPGQGSKFKVSLPSTD